MWVEKDELKKKLFSFLMEFVANIKAFGPIFYPEKNAAINKEPQGKN